MTLEDIKEGDKICIKTFTDSRVVQFIEFLSYDQFLCKYNEEFVICNVSEICLDDDKIILIQEYHKCREHIKMLYEDLRLVENIKSDLKNKIFSK